jgi:hypothetical protein
VHADARHQNQQPQRGVDREEDWLVRARPGAVTTRTPLVGGRHPGIQVDAHAKPILDEEHHEDRDAVLAQP